ncbi:MAG: alpha/beta fold hydrolase [Candidatus Pacebacteria bacterium]|nr:alpha/beta fold hydrolase [Candidatus Paceibacterota bacterium]MDD5356879.1 alpha/beta fold hydrolase [Candidatus Paceibacterota bacterium]
MEKTEIPGNGYSLDGHIFRPDSKVAKKAAVLLLHGWNSTQERMFDTAKMLAEKFGFVCLTLDLRGHGKSADDKNSLSRRDFLQDVIAGYDFLAKRSEVDTEKIGVSGSSFGGYLALLLSQKRNLNFIILRAPADYPDETFETPKGMIFEQAKINEWREHKRDSESTFALRAIHTFPGEILIIESEKDEMVPHQTILNFKNAITDSKHLEHALIKNAPHSLSKYPELQKEANEIIARWIQKRQRLSS